MAVLYTNNAVSALSASITSTATSFSVTAGHGVKFPALSGVDYFYVTLYNNAGNIEIVKVTASATDTFTVVRAQDGTSGLAFTAADKVELRVTKAVLDDIKTDTKSSLTSGNVTTALGFTPYNATNPTGYITSAGSVSQLNGKISSAFSGPDSAVKQYFWTTLAASATQARTFEIARLGIDYNDWNVVGPFEVELYERYYSQGLKKKYVISYGTNQNSTIQLVEYSGTGVNNFRVRIGTPVLVTGDNYYLPVFVDVRDYSQVDVRGTTNRPSTASTLPGIGLTYINASPTATNISDFSADSTVNFASVATVQVAGNQILHAGNYNSYAPTLTGGGASGTWGISVTGNSATVGGFTPSASSGVGSRVVVADSNGYIFNNYFNSTDNAITSGVSAIMSKAGDNYYRSASAAAVATFISGQSFNTTGTAANVTGTVAVGNGGTGQTTGYKLFDVVFTSNINANTDRTAGSYGSYASSATNTPTGSGILYNFMSGTGGAGDGGQFWQDYINNNLYLRQRWGGTYGSWLTILSASNYNSYAPTLTGTGASGTWGISITGNAATVTGGITTSNYTTYAVKRTGALGDVDLNSATYYTGSQVLGYNNASNKPGNAYGTMLSLNERGDTCMQLVVDYASGYLFSRGIYTGGPTYSAWRTCLNDANYSSYALPLSGGTLTGNLTISGGGTAILKTNGDITVYRSGGTTGVIFLNSAETRYLYYDGTNYNLNVASLVVGGNVTAYSDERVKTNWRELQPDFIEQLAKVKHGIYDRTDQEMTQVGVSAQSLRPVLEHAVLENEDGTLAVAYGNAAMVSAVELAKRVVEQDARIARLETLVSKLIGD